MLPEKKNDNANRFRLLWVRILSRINYFQRYNQEIAEILVPIYGFSYQIFLLEVKFRKVGGSKMMKIIKRVKHV